MPKVSVTHEVTEEQLSSLLCSAMEGGSNYWAEIVEFKAPPEMKFRTDPTHVFKHIDYPMNPGGSITLIDSEIPEEKFELTYEKLVAGLQVLAKDYPGHMANIISENDDAETGDALVQCALFGKLVYG